MFSIWVASRLRELWHHWCEVRYRKDWNGRNKGHSVGHHYLHVATLRHPSSLPASPSFSIFSFFKNKTKQNYFAYKLQPVKKIRDIYIYTSLKTKRKINEPLLLTSTLSTQAGCKAQGTNLLNVEGYGTICPGRSTTLKRRGSSHGGGEVLLMKVAVKLAGLEVVAHIVMSCSSSHQSNQLHPSFSVYILIGL